MMQFDAATHTYTLDGKVLPSVTGILDPLSDYAGIPRAIMEAARVRGEHVHKACELWLWNSLDEDSLAPEYTPYLDAFKLFMQETGFVAEHIEERVCHVGLMYAGTLDLAGLMPKGKSHRRALVDLKTTFKLMPAVGPQTAAYQEAWNSQHEKDLQLQDRYGLQLKKDGTYKLVPYTSPSDFNVFRSCLVIHNFMRNHK